LKKEEQDGKVKGVFSMFQKEIEPLKRREKKASEVRKGF